MTQSTTQPYHPRRLEAGNTLLMVMIFMTIMMGLAAALAQFISTEGTEIEQHLARSRLYFAMRGVTSYIGAKASIDGTFISSGDDGKITQVASYLNSLNNSTLSGETAIKIGTSSTLSASPLATRIPVTFNYFDYAAAARSYLFTFNADIINSSGTADGELSFEMKQTTPDLDGGNSIVPMLEGMENRTLGLNVVYQFSITGMKRILTTTY
ncbi:hypothetical protein ACQZV8_03385 [Magnetococcales bacterium HHB-1]